ncbi:helix-turn-helix domain-containing protein [Paenibacillus sp. Y412MC10]|uniref:helix-turn-helix domain-containing protein n=1 Tax=Geobacillus sp. (strain Y412MC10) TaxID=481743 RepID=UPI0011AB4914|nr:helix-turn-helix transcriptional regulator [Paenibacillus sp. Y412MC10]
MENFPTELQDFDPVKVGLNIKYERKKSGMSIKQLSEDVNISVGKLSYLEKGQLSKDRSSEIMNEIKTIAEALNIPLTNILNDDALIKPPIEKYYADIDLCLNFIVGGLYKEARKLINEILQKLTPVEERWVQPALLFLEAEIYASTGEQENALKYFKAISTLSGHHTLLNHYKVRAFNALALDSMNHSRTAEALLYLKRALQYSDKNLAAEQRANTYFNLAILYGFIGYLDVAVIHGKNAETLSHDNTTFLSEIRFLMGILFMLQNEADEAMTYISEALSFYRKTKDFNSIGNMYKCFYLLYRIDPHQYSSIRTFFEEDYLTTVKTQPLVKIDYLHTWIELMLEENQLENIEKQLEYCFEASTGIPQRLNFRSHWLAAQYYKQIGDQVKQEQELNMAKQYLDSTMERESAFIQYDLALIREPNTMSHFATAAEMLKKIVDQNLVNNSLQQMISLIPKFRY